MFWEEGCFFFFAQEMKAHARHKIGSRSLKSPTAHLPSDLEQVREIWRWSTVPYSSTEGENERVGESSAAGHREHARPSSCPRQES